MSKKEFDGYGTGSCFTGVVLVTIASIKFGSMFGGFGDLFEGNLLLVLENIVGLLVVFVGAYIIFYIGITIYNILLKRLEFLKKPWLKGIAVSLMAAGLIWIMENWG